MKKVTTLLFICLSLILSLFTHANAATSYQAQALPYFDSIIIRLDKLPFHVEYRTGKNYKVSFPSSNIDWKKVITIQGNELHIHEPSHWYHTQSLPVVIESPSLQQFTAMGKGSVNMHVSTAFLNLRLGRQVQANVHGRVGLRALTMSEDSRLYLTGLHSQSVNLSLNGFSQANLEGYANAQRVELGGNSQLKLHWVDSNLLWIRMRDESFAELAGKARVIDAKVSDGSHLDARYVRAEKGYVATYAASQADIWTKQTLNASANGISSVYFYRKPDLKNAFMTKNGAVLTGSVHSSLWYQDEQMSWEHGK